MWAMVMNREEFVKSLYDDAEEELKEVYKKQNKNKDDLLNEIAKILLIYTIADNVLSLSDKEKKSTYSKLSSKLLKMFGTETKDTTKIITGILNDVIKKDFGSYGISCYEDEMLKLINEHYKGKHFSDRIWDNENEVCKKLHKEVKDFLDGKVNANQIKSHIETQFDSNKYNARRLVNDQIAQLESKITERYLKEYGIKKVKYNACLCNTCEKCMSYHQRVFDVDDPNRPVLPQHVQCKCFYVQEDEKALVMNLQLFGINEKKELQKLINDGTIDVANYNKCYRYFNEQFKKGVITPIETVYNDNDNDRFIHIARRHKNMISKDEINNIINSLESPDRIYKSVDKFGIQAKGYVKEIDKNELLTIVRNGIITSYYPGGNYINNKIKKGEFELIWERK